MIFNSNNHFTENQKPQLYIHFEDDDTTNKVQIDKIKQQNQTILNNNQGVLFQNSLYTKQSAMSFAYVPNRSLGVDVSSYQGTDLTPFVNQGIKFVIVKTTQGTWYVNPNARGQIESAKRYHLMLEGYHYATFGDNSNYAYNEANYAVSHAESLGIPKGSYFACDYETNASGNINANTQAVKTFMRTVQRAGYIPVLYSGAYYMRDHLNLNDILQEFPNSLWVASYKTMASQYNPDFNFFPSMNGVMIWQFGSKWRGMNVDADVNVLPLQDNVGNSSQPNRPTPPKISDGQHKIGNYWYYYRNGQPVKNQYVWISDENKECYYNNDGHMVYGEQNINGHWQYFDTSTGAQVKNNFVDLPDGRSVYYDGNGNMIYGLQEVWGAKRYFNTTNGAEAKNQFVNIDGKTYYFGSDGSMVYGKQSINGQEYLFNSDGSLAKNQLVNIDGKTYYANGNGQVVYDQDVNVDGKHYHMNNDGNPESDGWQYYDGAEHYFKNGQMLTGWQTIDGNKVYFDTQNGSQYKNGFHCINGNTYYFDNNGHLLNGLQNLNGNTYLFGSDGQLEYGRHFYQGNWYYFDEATGAMVKNQFKTIYDFYHGNQQTVYFDNQGKMVVNQWHAINGQEYYFDNNGNLAQSGVYRFKEPNGQIALIYFDNQGKQQSLSGWQEINGKWYYFDDNSGMAEHDCFKKTTDNQGKQIIVYLDNKGQRATGTLQIDNQTYVFDNNTGALIQGNPPANIN